MTDTCSNFPKSVLLTCGILQLWDDSKKTGEILVDKKKKHKHHPHYSLFIPKVSQHISVLFGLFQKEYQTPCPSVPMIKRF